MNVTACSLSDVLLIEPKVFDDDRGFFFESFNQRAFNHATGLDVTFVQDNHSRSERRVLRGLHYQVEQPQGKLVRVVQGEVFDVAVDIRQDSATFGRWVCNVLSAENKKQLWIPPGFAHGFLVLSDSADFVYKTTEYYCAAYERCIAWNDMDLGISWPLKEAPKMSAKDWSAPSVREVFGEY